MAQDIKNADSFTGHTVSTKMNVTGRDTLKVHDVIVCDKGNLILSSPYGINIDGEFEVKLGGILTVDRAVRGWNYEYDSNGNRVKKAIIYW